MCLTVPKIWLIFNIKLADCEPYGNSPSGEAAQMPAHAISKRGLALEPQLENTHETPQSSRAEGLLKSSVSVIGAPLVAQW